MPSAIRSFARMLLAAAALAVASFQAVAAVTPAEIARLYEAILQREPDAAGLAYWTAETARLARQPASAFAISNAIAEAMFSSAEYGALRRDDAQYVADLYEAYLDRAPDPEGQAYWSGRVARTGREAVRAAFVNSPERVMVASRAVGYHPFAANDFIIDVQRVLTGWPPDEAMLQWWAATLQATRCDGGLISAGVASLAAAAPASSEAQFVSRLYAALLQRDADDGGFDFWVGAVSAAGRQQVVNAFVNSREFQAHVSEVLRFTCPAPPPPA